MRARVLSANGISPTGGCLQDKIVALSDANAVLDAAAHEAKAAQSRVQQGKVSKACSIKALLLLKTGAAA